MSTWSTSRYPTGDSTLVAVTTWYGGDASTTRWNRVDEASPDDSDYIGIQSTVGKVIFSFSSFAVMSEATIENLTIYYRLRKLVTASAANMRVILRVGTTDHVQTGINPTTLWASTYVTYANNPHTGLPWTAAEINGSAASGALVGFGVGSADVAPEPQLSQIYAVVNYQWTQELSLSITNCTHAHAASTATISQAHILMVSNALHLQNVDVATITEIVPMLSIANALHNHSVTNAMITIQGGAGQKHGAFVLCLRRSM